MLSALIAERAWFRRVATEDTQFHEVPETCEILGDQHNWALKDSSFPEYQRLRAAMGRPLDAQCLEHIRKRPAETFQCRCGQDGPSATHLTFACPLRLQGVETLPPPEHPLEERL